MPPPSEPITVDLDVDQRLSLLRTVATAIIELADAGDPATFAMPYPGEAQRALDRMVLSCLRRGAQPPRSVVDLVRWSRERAIVDWPLELPDDIVTPDDHLIDAESGQPTQLCQELAVRGQDSAVEQYDQAVIRAAIRLSRQADSPQTYEDFRRLLIEKPVLTAQQYFAETLRLSLDPVRELINQIYEPVHVGYLHDGIYRACKRCKTLLTPLTDGNWSCGRDVCRRQGPAPGPPLRADEVGELLHLARPLRQFVTWPGRAELDLERHLLALGAARISASSPTSPETAVKAGRLHIQMWPEFDAYDLRVTFPDGHVWAIDVKDWASPVLLGQRASKVRPTPNYDEAFWVVPRHRLDIRRDYLDVYYRHRATAAGGLLLLTDKQTVDKAKERLKTGTAG